MKFTDTMSSFKYMGGSLPIHMAMLYYGWLITHEGFPLVKLNEECKRVKEVPKLDNDDIHNMMKAHMMCIFVICANKLLNFQTRIDASYLLVFLRYAYIFVYMLALLYCQMKTKL